METYLGKTRSFEHAPQREEYDDDEYYSAACKLYELEVSIKNDSAIRIDMKGICKALSTKQLHALHHDWKSRFDTIKIYKFLIVLRDEVKQRKDGEPYWRDMRLT